MFTVTPSIVSTLNNGGHLTILIADDDPDLRSALRTLFEEDGHLVEEMKNGLDVVEACQEIRPNIIWLTVKLPQLDRLRGLRWDERLGTMAFRL